MSAIFQTPADPYAELCDLPEHLTGEILNGVLHTQPRPAGPHALASSALGAGLFGSQHGDGNSGGWWIIDEPEIHFIRDAEVCVPDIAGWRRERMPTIPRGHRFEVVPDWVCEILSPGHGAQGPCGENADLCPSWRGLSLVGRSAGTDAGSL